MRAPSRFSTPPSSEDLSALAEAALATIPAGLARHLEGVGIMIEERPDRATLREMGLRSPWQLTGLYRGTPLNLRSISDPARPPDTIYLYREPILLEWIETGADLAEIVTNVVIHEVAHHFGFSDEQIYGLEREEPDHPP